MKIKFGKGKTEYGTGVEINLTGNEVATAIDAYLTAHDINVFGARTITVNGKLCKSGQIYVDPSGEVVANGIRYSGRGRKTNTHDKWKWLKHYSGLSFAEAMNDELFKHTFRKASSADKKFLANYFRKKS